MSPRPKCVLITGGTGFIGSHTILELLNYGVDIHVIDNFSNSSEVSLKRVESIFAQTGKPYTLKLTQVCLTDKIALRDYFKTAPTFCAVIHFAGLKAVGESSEIPLDYYAANVVGAINLLQCMEEFNCRNIIFSSSATVYGVPKVVPTPETASVGATNCYGRTKLFIEEILKDLSVGKSGPNWKIITLRYFNPVGAHKSGLIGEDPTGIPNNLTPFLSQVAVGRLKQLRVFGNDYPTVDGTGVRDYVHVLDLARGHIAALFEGLFGYMAKPGAPNHEVFNLGSGKGVSVLQMVKFMEIASGKAIPIEIVERRPGDVAEIYADSSKAWRLLNWKTELTIEEAIADSWRWQSSNPEGFKQ